MPLLTRFLTFFSYLLAKRRNLGELSKGPNHLINKKE